jgi:hypothetical protein
MASAIVTVGAIAFAIFILTVLILATVSQVKKRRRGHQHDDEVGGDYPTSEGPTPGFWGDN